MYNGLLLLALLLDLLSASDVTGRLARSVTFDTYWFQTEAGDRGHVKGRLFFNCFIMLDAQWPICFRHVGVYSPLMSDSCSSSVAFTCRSTENQNYNLNLKHC